MSYLKSASLNFLRCKVSCKNKKTLNLGPKQFNKNYYKIFNQLPQIWKHKVSSKTKKTFLGPKMLCLGLWTGMMKNYCHICNQRPSIYLTAKFCTKIRIVKFGTKNTLFGCFAQKFWKTIVIFEISAALQVDLLQNLCKK